MKTPIRRILLSSIVPLFAFGLGVALQYHGSWHTHISQWMGLALLMAWIHHTPTPFRSPSAATLLFCTIGLIPLFTVSNPIVPISFVLSAYFLHRNQSTFYSVDGYTKALGIASVLGMASWIAPFTNDNIIVSICSCGFLAVLTHNAPLFAQIPLPHSSHKATLPNTFELFTKLRGPFRQPVYRAILLCRQARTQVSDRHTRAGLIEIVRWVFRLQQVANRLTVRIESIHVEEIYKQMNAHKNSRSSDALTLERKKETQKHLEKLLQHRDSMALEIERTEAMVEFANAFLEEVNASLYLSKTRNYSFQPDRLPDVLHRLRSHAIGESARSQTQIELATLNSPTYSLGS